jgi:single-strand DNA-binding protein
MINRIILVGRMVADPELRYTPSGVAVARFRMAVDRGFKSAQGEQQTDFIDIVAWRQTAQFVSDYLRKGRLIGVDGRLQIRQYTTQDGQKRKAAEVVAERVQALDRGRDEDRAAGGAPGPTGEPVGEEHAPDDFPDVFEGQ